jgi:hypothetical protein
VAHSVYDYVTLKHDYGQVVVARERVRDMIRSGDVCCNPSRAAYASVRHNDDLTLCSGCLKGERKREQTQKQYCRYEA